VDVLFLYCDIFHKCMTNYYIRYQEEVKQNANI